MFKRQKTSFLGITNFTGDVLLAVVSGWYNFRNATAERYDCISFCILQECDNLWNGTAERTMIARNGTLTQP